MKWIELRTEQRDKPYLSNDPQPPRLPRIRVRGRWRLDAFGRYWSPWELLALALGVGMAWWLLGRTR